MTNRTALYAYTLWWYSINIPYCNQTYGTIIAKAWINNLAAFVALYRDEKKKRSLQDIRRRNEWIMNRINHQSNHFTLTYPYNTEMLMACLHDWKFIFPHSLWPEPKGAKYRQIFFLQNLMRSCENKNNKQQKEQEQEQQHHRTEQQRKHETGRSCYYCFCCCNNNNDCC